MRKFLLGTSAIVGVGMIAAPAAASERIKLSLGGYMEQYVGFIDAESDKDGTGGRDLASFDQQDDNEVFFSGSTTLDNGIKLAVRMELEANESATGMDEAYLNISSDTMGLLVVGGDDVASGKTNVGPARGISGDYDNWVPAVNITKNDNAYDSGNSSDANKLTYFTPRIGGIQVAASYVPESGNSGNDARNKQVDNGSAWSASLSYKEEFMGGLGVNAVVGVYDQDKNGPGSAMMGYRGERNYNFGLNVSYQGFTVGGSWGRSTDDNMPADGTMMSSDEGRTVNAGLQYAAGAYKVGVFWLHSDREGRMDIAKNDEATAFTAWGEYQLGDGVKLQGLIFNAEYDEEADMDATELDGGWGVVVGTKLDF